VGSEIIIAAGSAAIGAFGGIAKAHNNFKTKLNSRFEKIEDSIDQLRNSIVHDYVLKEDFLREMQAVHSKLDRILDYLIMQKPN
jgi:hypothetical protein